MWCTAIPRTPGWNRFRSSRSGSSTDRAKLQSVFCLHAPELHREAPPLIMRLPLVLVVTGKWLPGLAHLLVQQRSIPVAQVRVHTHGRRECAGGLADGGARSAHRHRADFKNIERLADERQPLHELADHRVIDLDTQIRSVAPARHVAALNALAFFYRVHQCAEEHSVEIGEPALRALPQKLLYHGRRHAERIERALVGSGG